MSELPAVSLVVLNWNGRKHLATCLGSLAALDYPRDRLELIVCDNGSTDGSTDYVSSTFPGVRVLALDRNYGFAEANDKAARSAKKDWVGFLNNDMSVRPDWLRQLVAPLEEQPGLACLASRILNWNGSAIDFIGGGLNFQGHGVQLDYGAPSSSHDRPRKVLFACGGAMLVRRELFLEVGGFDPLFFSLFEDVDLGWRLNLLGHDVWYTPAATVLHKHHATLRRLPSFQRQMLAERNALFTIYKNYDDANLAAILPVALMLLNEKALRMARVDAAAYRLPDMQVLQAPPEVKPPAPPPRESSASKALLTLRRDGPLAVARKAARRLSWENAVQPRLEKLGPRPRLARSQQVAVSELAHNLDHLNKSRRWLQERRKRSDEEVLGLDRVLLPDPSYRDPHYSSFQRWLCEVSGVDERFRRIKL